MISSGFLHVDWSHFIFNMLSLYFFAPYLELSLGPIELLIIYFASLLGGNFLALFLHRSEPEYRAVGASGAVSGVIFAAIALIPGMKLGLILLPIAFPGWIYGLLFVLYSIYGIRSKKDNIGHDAHLGGGIIGMVIALILRPQMLTINPLPITLVLVPSIIFLVVIIYKPMLLQTPNPFKKGPGLLTRDDQFNINRKKEQEEIDYLLDKISKKGVGSLTEDEKRRLKKLSE